MSVQLPLALAEAHPVLVAGDFGLGSGRTLPLVAVVLTLGGLVLGAMAVRRPDRTKSVAAVVLGLTGVIVGGLHAANSAGGPGTGNGLLGAVFAMVLGLAGIVLGCLAVVRSRRTE